MGTPLIYTISAFGIPLVTVAVLYLLFRLALHSATRLRG